MMTNDEIKSMLKERLTEYRYIHSLGVADMAKGLASRYGCDKDKAYFAGLVHDVMKDMPRDQMKQYIERNGIVMTELEKNAPKLWHAILGADYIRRVMGVTDSDVINAVRYHTTGRAGMSLLEKIVYIADYTSADRNYDGVEEMRDAAEKSIEKAMQISLEFTISDLSGKNVPVHPDTLAAYEEIMGGNG